MEPVITRKQLLSFWPDVLGIGALVLPFVADVSPLDVLSGNKHLDFFFAAAVFILAIPIAAWQVLRVLRDVSTKGGRVLAYALSMGAILSAVYFGVGVTTAMLQSNSKFLLFLGLAVVSVLTLIVANVLLLRHNLKVAAPAEVTAGVFLVGGYLPHAAFFLLFFSNGWPPAWATFGHSLSYAQVSPGGPSRCSALGQPPHRRHNHPDVAAAGQENDVGAGIPPP